MKWDIKTFIDSGLLLQDFDMALEISHVRLGRSRFVKMLKPLKIAGQLFRVEDQIWIRVHAEYEYQVKCDRCLRLYETTGTVELEAQIVERIPEDEEEGLFVLYKEGSLEIEDTLERVILVNFPMKHLCSEECRGLCPKCGLNLNEETCDCKKDEEVDIRLFELTKFNER